MLVRTTNDHRNIVNRLENAFVLSIYAIFFSLHYSRFQLILILFAIFVYVFLLSFTCLHCNEFQTKVHLLSNFFRSLFACCCVLLIILLLLRFLMMMCRFSPLAKLHSLTKFSTRYRSNQINGPSRHRVLYFS